jgi:protoporphyrinogen oxidase
MMQEELGYIEGGSQALVDALCSAILERGGQISIGCAAQKVLVEDGRVTGVLTSKGVIQADNVISTVPTPLVSTMVPDLPADWKARYDSIINMGVCCLVFKLKRSVSPHFWVNISEPDIAIPGIIEFSNLRPVGGDSIVYVPYYMPNDNAKFAWTDEKFFEEAFGYLCRVNPALTRGILSPPILLAFVMRNRSVSLASQQSFPLSRLQFMAFRSPTRAFTIPKTGESQRACSSAKGWPTWSSGHD